MTPTNEKLVKTIRSSKFESLSKMFVYANKTAYVSLRLYEEYHSKAQSDKQFEELEEGALIDSADYLDKSIKALYAIKNEVQRLLPSIRTAELSSSRERDNISDGLRYYVQVEKDWQSLNELADSLERSGSEGQEKEVMSDITNLFKDIVMNTEHSISVFKQVQNKILDQLEA